MLKEEAVSLSDIDLYNPDVYVQGVPHHWFKLLRREAPIFRHPEPYGPGFWAITKYEDVDAISMDTQTFSSERMGFLIGDPDPEALPMLRGMLLAQDPPKHTKYRRLVSRGFTPKVMQGLEPHVRKIATDIIDGVIEKGECDFVTELAAEMPLLVILEMLGVPVEDRKMVFDWSNRLIGFEDPEYATSQEDARDASISMFTYANQLAVDRKANPRDDVITKLVTSEIDGEALSEVEFDAFFLLLAVAGNETTRNLISGGMLALFEHPDQRKRLMDDMSLLPPAVDEMLRWVSPVMYFRRTVTRDTELRGQVLREGDKVAMYYGSANRDEDVFPDPDTFDIARDPNPHVAFGPGGAHFCLGANLARLEIRIMFEEMLTRMPDMELAGKVNRLRSNFINGIKHMPVRFTPGARA